jgi:hypothetical protein
LGTALTCGALVFAAPQAEAAASASAFSEVIISITGYRDAGGGAASKPADFLVSFNGGANNDQTAYGSASAQANTSASVNGTSLTVTSDAFASADEPGFNFGLATGTGTGSVDLTNPYFDSYYVDFSISFETFGNASADNGDFEFAEAAFDLDLSSSDGSISFPDWDELVDNFGPLFDFDENGSFDFSVLVAGGGGGYLDITAVTSAYALSQVPVPAALPLLATALAGLGVVARRRVQA